MKNTVTLAELREAIKDIYAEMGASGIQTTEAGESIEHYLATLSGINTAVIMMAARLFKPELDEMDEIEKLNDAGQEYAVDMVRNHYQRIVKQI